MKVKVLLSFIVLVLLSSCGDKPGRGLNYEGAEYNQGSSPEGSVELSGKYDVISATFDSDPSPEHAALITLGTSLSDVEGSTDGEEWTDELRIEGAYLDFASDENFGFYYKISGASSYGVTVGNLSEGFASGTYEILGSVVSFNVTNGNGLADMADSNYQISTGSSGIVLRASIPSLTTDYFTALVLE